MINKNCISYDLMPDDQGMIDYCLLLRHELEDCGSCRNYNKPRREGRTVCSSDESRGSDTRSYDVKGDRLVTKE